MPSLPQFQNVPALILSQTKSNSADTADQDGTDAEYLGTYSLGPVSLVVQPSVAEDGKLICLTSCFSNKVVTPNSFA